MSGGAVNERVSDLVGEDLYCEFHGKKFEQMGLSISL